MLVPLIVPHVDPVYVNVYVLIVKYAVSVLFHVTMSCLVATTLPSLHHENVYPVFAIAVTVVPLKL